MKKLIASLSLVLVVALGVVGFSACSTKVTSKTLCGNWLLIKQKIVYQDGQIDETTNKNGMYVFHFSKDGTGYSGSVNGEGKSEFTWSLTKSTLTLKYFDISNSTDTFKISQKGKKLIFKMKYDGVNATSTLKKTK